MSASPIPEPDLSTEAVSAWLKRHPDFFADRDGLLAELSLPHHSGAAVSLVERQVSVLRDRNTDLRRRMQQLLDAARQNDRLFDNSRKLVLALLDAQTLEQLLVTVEESLARDFSADAHRLLLWNQPALPAIGQACNVSETDARAALGSLLDSGRVICGVLREGERDFLFGAGSGVQSAAVVPLKDTGLFGVLAIGSRDPHRFQTQMGTLFLEYLADILGRLLPRLLPAA